MVASSAAWVEKYSQQIKDCISKINYINHITWRPSIDILKEEGLVLSDSRGVELSRSPRVVEVIPLTSQNFATKLDELRKNIDSQRFSHVQ